MFTVRLSHLAVATALIGTFAISAPHAAWAQSARTPGWEVEFHGGAAASTAPADGTAAPLPVGETFLVPGNARQSRRVSSWLFGDGTALINAVNSTLAPTSKITPLDPVIGSAAASRRTGANVGARVTRRFGSRYSAEFNVDYTKTPLRFTQDALDGIEASRSSFVRAFRGTFLSGPSQNPAVTATAAITEGSGSEFLTTGVFGVDLVTRGRLIPFVVAGGGVAHSSGSAPAATLVGNYAFPLPGLPGINETDTVTIRIASPANAPVGVFGGGVRYAASQRWGIRGDVRFLVGGGAPDVLVDASPSVVTSSPGVLLASPTTPTAVFSSVAQLPPSLAGPAITKLRTFEGSGTAVRTTVTAGVYLRF